MSKTLSIREDFRRDGLAANFLVDGQMMKEVAQSLPGQILDVGYPAICEAEENKVREILSALKGVDVEAGIYSHADGHHLSQISEIARDFPHLKLSACFWVPTSRVFLSNTLKKGLPEVIANCTELVREFKAKNSIPIDVALADTTQPEEGLAEGVAEFTRELHNAGARAVIICDSLGIGTTELVENLFEKLRGVDTGEIEFHPHNDNGLALKNIEIATNFGVSRINTGLLKGSERGTLLDPRDLIKAGYDIKLERDKLAEFESEYREKIGEPNEVVNEIYGENIIITGSQYRLRGRYSGAQLRFGITSDRFMTGEFLDAPRESITRELLDGIKTELYKRKKLYFSIDEVREVARELGFNTEPYREMRKPK